MTTKYFPLDMSSVVIRTLYRALLLSTRQLERDLEDGRTLLAAVRSGAVQSYTGIKRDWQRERNFERRFVDMKNVQHWNRKSAFASLVRSQFEQPIGEGVDAKAVRSQRIDAAFSSLRDVDNQITMIRNFAVDGAFDPIRRTEEVKFSVGDVVQVNEAGVGVIGGWRFLRIPKKSIKPTVVYEILPHTTDPSDRGHLHGVPQDEIQLAINPVAVQHPSLLLYFDGFENERHVPSPQLARRYPEDFKPDESQSAEVVNVPSILQLHSADEAQLVQYLRCNDRTIVQFAIASLEGKWLSAFGSEAQDSVEKALAEMDKGDLDAARTLLEQVVVECPEYAVAWSKLAMVEFRAGNTEEAMTHYQVALAHKPHLLEALAGLATCATKLRQWEMAHSAANRLLRVQPSDHFAQLVLENAIHASL